MTLDFSQKIPVWNDFERLTQNPHLKWLWTSHKKSPSGMTLSFWWKSTSKMTLNFSQKIPVWNDLELFCKLSLSGMNLNFHKTSPSGMTLNFCKNTRLECLWTCWRKKEKSVWNDFDNFAKTSVWNDLEPFPVWNNFGLFTKNPRLEWLWTFDPKSPSEMTLNFSQRIPVWNDFEILVKLHV